MTYIDATKAPAANTGQIKLHGPEAFAAMHKAGRLAAEVADKAIVDCADQLDAVAVHAHPDAVATVAEHLGKLTRGCNGVRFEVRADDRLAANGCELHTAFGIVEASVDMQLDALERHIGAADRD